jgi:hypothetical protein
MKSRRWKLYLFRPLGWLLYIVGSYYALIALRAIIRNEDHTNGLLGIGIAILGMVSVWLGTQHGCRQERIVSVVGSLGGLMFVPTSLAFLFLQNKGGESMVPVLIWFISILVMILSSALGLLWKNPIAEYKRAEVDDGAA